MGESDGQPGALLLKSQQEERGKPTYELWIFSRDAGGRVVHPQVGRRAKWELRL